MGEKSVPTAPVTLTYNSAPTIMTNAMMAMMLRIENHTPWVYLKGTRYDYFSTLRDISQTQVLIGYGGRPLLEVVDEPLVVLFSKVDEPVVGVAVGEAGGVGVGEMGGGVGDDLVGLDVGPFDEGWRGGGDLVDDVVLATVGVRDVERYFGDEAGAGEKGLEASGAVGGGFGAILGEEGDDDVAAGLEDGGLFFL